MEKYEKLEKIGEGTDAKVYKARHRDTGQLVTLKKTKLDMELEGVPRSTVRETSLLRLLSDSVYIVRLLFVQEARTKKGKSVLYLGFEYLDTDLKKFIRTYPPMASHSSALPPSLIKNFLYQICKGVCYCHSHAVLHRDLKPDNILVDQTKGILKISDLGFARTFTLPMTAYSPDIVTLNYMAPEILLGSTHSHYATGVDMWSVGCIFAEMSIRKPLFHGNSEYHTLIHIFRLLGTPTEENYPGVTSLRNWHEYPQWKPLDLESVVPEMDDALGKDLLLKMLKYNHVERISAKEALNHTYFDTLDKSQF